jgi:hypothetical protein
MSADTLYSSLFFDIGAMASGFANFDPICWYFQQILLCEKRIFPIDFEPFQTYV